MLSKLSIWLQKLSVIFLKRKKQNHELTLSAKLEKTIFQKLKNYKKDLVKHLLMSDTA